MSTKQFMKCPYLEIFWSLFYRILTEYEEMWSISPYSVRMRENTEHSEYGHFLRTEKVINTHTNLQLSDAAFLSMYDFFVDTRRWRVNRQKKNFCQRAIDHVLNNASKKFKQKSFLSGFKVLLEICHYYLTRKFTDNQICSLFLPVVS